MPIPAITQVFQLNTPHCTPVTDGGSCGGDDCAICCMMMAIDWSVDHDFMPTQKQVRQRPTVPRTGGLELEDVSNGITEFFERFHARGFMTPRVRVRDGVPITTLTDDLQNPALLVILFWDNGTWNDICKENHRPGLGGDLEYRGTHAVVASNLRWKSGTTQINNPLYDGRLDMPSRTRVRMGPQRVKNGWVRRAAEAYAGAGKASYVAVSKAERLQDAEPIPEPCDSATSTRSKVGRAGKGAI